MKGNSIVTPAQAGGHQGESEMDSRLRGNDGDICVITDELLGPLFGGVFRRKKRPQLDLLVQIKVGDPVVHLFHGVGIFRGIVRNTLSGTEREYIEIEYAEGDRLFVPVDELHRVSKFV